MIQEILTLSEILQQAYFNKDTRPLSIIGCVIDVTRPLYRQKEDNFIIEIKLIDDTVRNLNSQFSLIKHLVVYLIADKQEDLQFNFRVGDFVYLHKFTFSIWNNIFLITKYSGTLETFFQIKSGDITQTQDFSIMRRLGTELPKIDNLGISARIIQMKNWLVINFNSVFGPFIGIKIINNFCCSVEPFNLYLKVHKINIKDFQKQLVLLDAYGNYFYLDILEFKLLQLKINQWIFLRGIKNVNHDFRIILTSTGNILRLPKLFQQNYLQISNYQAVYTKSNQLNPKRQSTELTYCTISDNKVTSIKQLFGIQDKYQATFKKQDIILPNYYLVKGAVIGYKGKIKLYHKEYQMIIHDDYLNQIPIQQKKQIIGDKKLVYVYEGIIYFQDRSVTSKKQILKVRVFTNDQKYMFFDKKLLQNLNQFIGNSNIEQKTQQVKFKIQQKLQKLISQSTFQNSASLILEPIRSQELLFRLVNTKVA